MRQVVGIGDCPTLRGNFGGLCTAFSALTLLVRWGASMVICLAQGAD